MKMTGQCRNSNLGRVAGVKQGGKRGGTEGRHALNFTPVMSSVT